MCGLTGFIGKSNDIDLSYVLFNNLFVNTQIRGVDAAGIFAVDTQNNTTWLRDGVPSEVLINNPKFSSLENVDLNLMLGHCRQTSVGVGGAEDNLNNHPFVSNDKKIALIHNGRIDNDEYLKMKNVYKTDGNCDSEIVLRHIEKNYQDNEKNNTDIILDSLTHFVGLCPLSQYALAVGEINKNDRTLYLLRNVHRSLWYVDLREQLNQIFFVSTDEIFFSAILSSWADYLNVHKLKITKIEPHCIIKINLSDDNLKLSCYQIKLHQKIVLDYVR